MAHSSTTSCRFSRGFNDNCARLCFVRRVFAMMILALMLMFGQIMLVSVVDDVKSFLEENYWMAFIGTTIFISTCMVLSCSNLARSIFPWNFILFLLLVESSTLVLSVIAAKFATNVILISLAAQMVVYLALLILALVVPIDFTKWTIAFLLFFLITFTFAIFALISIYAFDLPMKNIFYSMIAVIVMSAATLLNLQVMFNAEIFELYPDDFILGAILMFADVIIFFMCCLKLMGFDTDEC